MLGLITCDRIGQFEFFIFKIVRASPAVLQNKSQFAILTKMIGSILPLAVKIVVISIGSK